MYAYAYKKIEGENLNHNIMYMDSHFLLGLLCMVMDVYVDHILNILSLYWKINSKVIASYSDQDPFEILCPYYVANVY